MDNNNETNDKLLIYGRNPVLEALKGGQGIERLLIQRNIEGAGKKIYAMAKKAGIPLRSVDKKDLDRAAGTTAHQGVVAYLTDFEYSTLEEVEVRADARAEPLFLVIACGIEDPHNLGSIIRSADGAGVHGVIIPTRHSVSVTPVVVKASAGAALHLPIVRVPNIAQCIAEIKEKNVWVYGLDMDGTDYHETDFSGALALAVGGEGSGLPRLIKESCDFVVSLPMRGKVSSLNAGNAAAIALYEMAHRRKKTEAEM